MASYILGRILQLVPVLFIVTVVVFAIMHLLPGDPALLMLQGAEGGVTSPERLGGVAPVDGAERLRRDAVLAVPVGRRRRRSR